MEKSQQTLSWNPGFKLENSFSHLPEVFFTPRAPVQVIAPKMVILNNSLATQMGLDFTEISEEDQATLFSGNIIPAGVHPLAQAYAGHQFGHFNMLGDGRAILIGEHIAPGGQRLDIQFKGSGKTPYSRGGDGRAAIAPMLREYVISEAMHELGIPTTRSLAVITTGEAVLREQGPLPGAILTRVARSHIRVGTFEFAAATREPEALSALLKYTVKRHYPELEGNDNLAIEFLKEAMTDQIDLVIEWMRVGFIHGVMNTDNMALSGETIDYGPCAFMDAYHPNCVFSSIDRRGRYAFGNQAAIVKWNMARLGEALMPLVSKDLDKATEAVKSVLDGFACVFNQKWTATMRAKLGLFTEQPEDESLVSDLLECMQCAGADYTNTFIDLTQGSPTEELSEDERKGLEYKWGKEFGTFNDWHKFWRARKGKDPQSFEASQRLMQNSNPSVIPRNHNVEQALDAATEGDLKKFYSLLAALHKPYSKTGAEREFYQRPPSPQERILQTFCGT